MSIIKQFTSSLTYDYIKRIYENKGYVFFDKGSFNLNIGSFRMSVGTDEFDDITFVAYRDQENKPVVELYTSTTDPGLYWLKHPMNKDGCFIMAPGQYRGAYKIGPHGSSKYEALRQNSEIAGFRDNNKDGVHDMDWDTLVSGIFWTNLHHAYDSAKVKKNSAGCQVLKYIKDLKRLLSLCKKSINKGYGKTFTYTLLEKKDLV